MFRRLIISSHLKTLTTTTTTNTISSTTRSPSPTVAVSFFSHHFSTQTDAVKNKVEDVMPIATGHEREDIQADLEMAKIIHGADFQKVRQVCGGKAVQGLWDPKNNQLPTRCAIKSAVCSVHMALHARGILNPLQLHSVGDSKILETMKGRRELDFYVDNKLFCTQGYRTTGQVHDALLEPKSCGGGLLSFIGKSSGVRGGSNPTRRKSQNLLLFGTEGTPATLRKHSYIFWVWERLLQAHEMDVSYMNDIMGTTKEERGDC